MKRLIFVTGFMIAFWFAVVTATATPHTASGMPQHVGLTSYPMAVGSPTPTCAPSWATVPSPNITGQNVINNQLRGISALASGDVWAAGYYAIEEFSERKSERRHPMDRFKDEQERSSKPNYHESYRTLIMHWNGTQWDIVPSPNAGSDDNELYMIDALAANDVWAAGYFINDFGVAQTLVIHWDGSEWSVVPTPNVSNLQENQLYSIEARAANDVWAVGQFSGENGALLTLTLHWDGAQWSIISSPNLSEDYNTLLDLTIVAPNEVWAAGYYINSIGTGRTLTLRWNGAQWAVVPSPNVGSSYNVFLSIDARMPDDIWAVGAFSSSSSGPRGLAVHWNGTGWTVYPTPSDPSGYIHLYGVDVLSANEAWAVGYTYGGLGEQAFVLKWDGLQWVRVRPLGSPESTRGVLYSVEALNSTDIWAAGGTGTYYAGRTLTQHYSTACVSCPTRFTDVPPSHTFYHSIQCLACQGIVGGYQPFPSPVPTGQPFPTPDPTTTPVPVEFRPNASITRGQLAKIVSNSVGLNDDPGPPMFEDVYPYSTYYLFVNRLARRGVMSGYPCGTVPHEPCRYGNLPYFRPNSSATRGQIAKIISNAAGYSETHTSQMFQDVPITNTFYIYIARLHTRGIIGGYQCGGSGEPCVPPANLPYFRPNTDATRAQVTKMAARTYFPNCYVP
jgi:hypothetical protein